MMTAEGEQSQVVNMLTRKLVCPEGFEPPTTPFQAAYSDQAELQAGEGE